MKLLASLVRHLVKRALWFGRKYSGKRGSLRLGLVSCGVALFAGLASALALTQHKTDKEISLTGSSSKSSSSNTDQALRDIPSLIPLGPGVNAYRNPFAAPAGTFGARVMPAPTVSIKGFSKNGSSNIVFMSINNQFDEQYRIGQEIGNGYRITEINPNRQEVHIYDGTNRFKYILQDY